MEVDSAIGLIAAPGIVAAVIAVFKPLLERLRTPSEVIPVLALLGGIAYTFAAWQGGVVDAANGVVAVLLGLTVGIGAVGAREAFRQARPPGDPQA